MAQRGPSLAPRPQFDFSIMEIVVNGTQSLRRVAALALFLPAVGYAQASPAKSTKPATTPAAGPASAQALPPARQIIDKYVAAVGGRDALMKHNSRHIVMTVEIPQAGVKAQGESFTARPDKALEKMNIPGMGELMEGFDGTTAWSVNPVQGPRLISGKQLEQRRHRASFDATLHQEESIKSLETVELADFEGKKAYKVKVTRTNGDESFEYFDVDSGLLVGSTMTMDTEMGQVTSNTVLSDYKEFDGVRMPTKVVVRSSVGPEFITTIDAVHHNVVPPTTFDLPAQIKALVGK
jgi:hypothetical protein